MSKQFPLREGFRVPRGWTLEPLAQEDFDFLMKNEGRVIQHIVLPSGRECPPGFWVAQKGNLKKILEPELSAIREREANADAKRITEARALNDSQSS